MPGLIELGLIKSLSNSIRHEIDVRRLQISISFSDELYFVPLYWWAHPAINILGLSCSNRSRTALTPKSGEQIDHFAPNKIVDINDIIASYLFELIHTTVELELIPVSFKKDEKARISFFILPGRSWNLNFHLYTLSCLWTIFDLKDLSKIYTGIRKPLRFDYRLWI